MSKKSVIFGLLIPAATAQVVSCVPAIPSAKCMSLAGSIPLEPRAVPLKCNILNFALDILQGLGAPATAFCCSYLNIPNVTTVVGPTVTPPPITTDIYITDTSTVTVYYPTGFQWKRDLDAVYHAPVHNVEARAVPAALKKVAASEISRACSCLHITPKSTSTLTITAPTPVITDTLTTNVLVTATTCNAPGGPCGPDCDPWLCCEGACRCDQGGVVINTCMHFN